MAVHLRPSLSSSRGTSSPGLATPRVGSFRVGVPVYGRTEQGGGDEGAEDNAARPQEEGCVVAGVEGGGLETFETRRVSSRDGGECREAQSTAHLLGGVHEARGQASLALGNADGGGQDHRHERERRSR